MDKILFLDDSMDRHESFIRSAPTYGYEVRHAYTARQAIDLIESERPVQVFLDHDLSEDDIMSEVGGVTHVPTGMTVVDHIMGMASPPMDVVVHSCNGPAAEEMERRLRSHPAGIRVRRIAFPYLIHTLYEAKKRSNR